MALDFPNAPTNGQIYTVTGSGEQWIYEAATNSWTSKGLVNTTGGLQYKGDINITAAPPTGAKAGEQYSVNPGGTADAGFGPGVTGTITKGSMMMYTGTGWIETSHSVPDATPVVKGIDTRKWNRTGTVLSPSTAGDVVNISAGTAALPGLTPVGDPNTGIYSPGADQLAVATNGTGRVFVGSAGLVGIGASSPRVSVHIFGTASNAPTLGVASGSLIVGPGNRDYGLAMGTAAAGYGWIQSQNFVAAGTAYNLLLQPSGGNVGINTTSPAVACDVVGQVRASTGILFGTDTAAANALDDYEEGTWTPTQEANLTVVGTFSSTGRYTKVGRQVFLEGVVAGSTSVAVSATNAIAIGGLPFATGYSRTPGLAGNEAISASATFQLVGTALYFMQTMAATTNIRFVVTYSI